MFHAFKRGGMRFVRIGRFQLSFCVTRPERPAKVRKATRHQCYRAGFNAGTDHAFGVARSLYQRDA